MGKGNENEVIVTRFKKDYQATYIKVLIESTESYKNREHHAYESYYFNHSLLLMTFQVGLCKRIRLIQPYLPDKSVFNISNNTGNAVIKATMFFLANIFFTFLDYLFVVFIFLGIKSYYRPFLYFSFIDIISCRIIMICLLKFPFTTTYWACIVCS